MHLYQEKVRANIGQPKGPGAKNKRLPFAHSMWQPSRRAANSIVAFWPREWVVHVAQTHHTAVAIFTTGRCRKTGIGGPDAPEIFPRAPSLRRQGDKETRRQGVGSRGVGVGVGESGSRGVGELGSWGDRELEEHPSSHRPPKLLLSCRSIHRFTNFPNSHAHFGPCRS